MARPVTGDVSPPFKSLGFFIEYPDIEDALTDSNSPSSDNVFATINDFETTPPAGHAASHKHGGSDEVGTSTVGTANAIPKADANGYLDTWVRAFPKATSVNVIATPYTLNAVAGTVYTVLADTVGSDCVVNIDGSTIESWGLFWIANASANGYTTTVNITGGGTLIPTGQSSITLTEAGECIGFQCAGFGNFQVISWGSPYTNRVPEYYFSRTLPADSGHYVEIGNYDAATASAYLRMTMTISGALGTKDGARDYFVPLMYVTGDADTDWILMRPLYCQEPAGQIMYMWMKRTGSVYYFRLTMTDDLRSATVTGKVEMISDAPPNKFNFTSGTAAWSETEDRETGIPMCLYNFTFPYGLVKGFSRAISGTPGDYVEVASISGHQYGSPALNVAVMFAQGGQSNTRLYSFVPEFGASDWSLVTPIGKNNQAQDNFELVSKGFELRLISKSISGTAYVVIMGAGVDSGLSGIGTMAVPTVRLGQAWLPILGTVTPVGAVTPDFIGQWYIDTALAASYQAMGATSADWKMMLQAPEEEI